MQGPTDEAALERRIDGGQAEPERGSRFAQEAGRGPVQAGPVGVDRNQRTPQTVHYVAEGR
jgi:hypothetical protein